MSSRTTQNLFHQQGGNLLRAKRRIEKLNRQRQRLLPRALILGLASGLMAVAFAKAMDAGESLRLALLASAHRFGHGGVILSILFSVITISLAIWLVRSFAPPAAGSGIPHLKGVLLGYRSMNWHRVLWVKFIGGVLGVTGGLTLGREGPTVQMGGALGQMLGCCSPAGDLVERRTLIAAGAGAGLSAIFNAPLAGLVFVLEELKGNFAPPVFFAAITASMTADVVSRSLMGQLPVFHVTVTAIPHLDSLPLFLALGILAGGLGVIFNRVLLVTQHLADFRTPRWVIGKWVVWGCVIGVIGWWMPEVCGGGQPLVNQILSSHSTISFWSIPILFGLRFFLTMGSYSTGAAGGIFAPLLVLGALLGLGVGQIGHEWFPLVVPDPLAVAVAGMAAYFTAIVRAPLTGIVLIIEMTGNYALILPLFTACFAAYVIAEWWPDVPIYEALLERDLEKDEDARPVQANPAWG